jgi:large subunit ribosomal protein L17
MRHKRVAKKFGRSKEHREQMVASLVVNLILRDRIHTTLQKARAARRDAEKMVTLARKGTLASRRLAAARLHRPDAVVRLFEKVVPAMEGRKGGYTRIIKDGHRLGDAAETAFLEWVAVIASVPVEAPVAADEKAVVAGKATGKKVAAKKG